MSATSYRLNQDVLCENCDSADTDPKINHGITRDHEGVWSDDTWGCNVCGYRFTAATEVAPEAVLTVNIYPNGDYSLIGEDGDLRSHGSLIDPAALAVDIQGHLEMSL